MPDGIVFIHAFPLDGSMWEPQIAAFEKRTEVIAPSLPGFGGEKSAGHVMTMAEAADRVAAAARVAGIGRALVCGLSMGGYVALALWQRHPQLVRGFVFANTKASADDEAAKDRRRQLADRLRSEGSQFLVDSPPPLLAEGAPAELREQVKAIIAKQPALSIAAAALGMAERPEMTPALKTITMPTLVITGSSDALIPPDATKPMADGIPGARYEVIEGSGHLSNLEATERFNILVGEHFKAIEKAELESTSRS